MPWPVHPTGFFGARGDNDTYRIERSLRFNSADLAYLNRTPASAGNRKTWTWSGWVKRGLQSADHVFFGNTDGSGYNGLYFQFTSTNKIQIGDYGVGSWDWQIVTTPVYRDSSAWYHIVAAIDTTQATASNRVKIYVNGTQVTSLDTSTYPSLNSDLRTNTTQFAAIGRLGSYNGFYFDGYLTEIHFIDGQALTPSSFGETDAITGRWKAKAYSGTYGTNGFYLSFKNNANVSALGTDQAFSDGKKAENNFWTVNNFSVTAGVGNDSLVDSPTNYGTDTGVGGEVRGNYATLNPLDIGPTSALANGNLDFSTSSGPNYSICRSTIGVSSGKWYWEILVNSSATANMVGVANSSATLSQYLGQNANGWGYYSDGQKYNNGSGSNYGASFTTNDIIGVALDMDAGTLVFYKNNSSQGTAFSGLSGTLFPTVSDASSASSANLICNFGQRPFAYTAPSGFKALCTTNLPQPTIQKPSKYMDVVAYTGTGASNSITGLDFSPDLVWIKNRGTTTSHAVYDTTRGTQLQLSTNSTAAEVTSSTGLTAFGSNGFTIGTSSLVNTSGTQYVAWSWDEAPIAGMDIVSYTGNGTNRTIAHNLGVAPKMIIVKNRNFVGSTNWCVYHSSLSSPANSVFLDTTDAQASYPTVWNSTAPTSSVFSVGTNLSSNGNGNNMIAYLFAEVEGFSRFGSYTGNGSADGPFVYCGFRPAFVMIKGSSFVSNWFIQDYQRSNFNLIEAALRPNLANSEVTGVSTYSLDTLSNGFKLRTSAGDSNTSSATFIFAAFAESPFKYARAR